MGIAGLKEAFSKGIYNTLALCADGHVLPVHPGVVQVRWPQAQVRSSVIFNFHDAKAYSVENAPILTASPRIFKLYIILTHHMKVGKTMPLMVSVGFTEM